MASAWVWMCLKGYDGGSFYFAHESETPITVDADPASWATKDTSHPRHSLCTFYVRIKGVWMEHGAKVVIIPELDTQDPSSIRILKA